ncbi:MAG TPA: hypothetical protein VF658_05365 [Pyrinomonadaceae bacterium]
MWRIIRYIAGIVLLVGGLFFFCVLTVDMTADIDIGGPMNMWPPPGWVYLILDAICVLLVFIGMRIIKLKPVVGGYIASFVGLLMLVMIIRNHINAPAREGVGGDDYVAADVGSYLLAYTLAVSALCVGLSFIIQHIGKRKIS